jgi:hypothetical protein
MSDGAPTGAAAKRRARSTKPKVAALKAATVRKAAAAETASPAAAFEASLAEAKSRRNLKLFNALMARHARFGELERVEQAFDACLRLPLAPNEYTFGILLNAFARSGVVERMPHIARTPD